MQVLPLLRAHVATRDQAAAEHDQALAERRASRARDLSRGAAVGRPEDRVADVDEHRLGGAHEVVDRLEADAPRLPGARAVRRGLEATFEVGARDRLAVRKRERLRLDELGPLDAIALAAAAAAHLEEQRLGGAEHRVDHVRRLESLGKRLAAVGRCEQALALGDEELLADARHRPTLVDRLARGERRRGEGRAAVARAQPHLLGAVEDDLSVGGEASTKAHAAHLGRLVDALPGGAPIGGAPEGLLRIRVAEGVGADEHERGLVVEHERVVDQRVGGERRAEDLPRGRARIEHDLTVALAGRLTAPLARALKRLLGLDGIDIGPRGGVEIELRERLASLVGRRHVLIADPFEIRLGVAALAARREGLEPDERTALLDLAVAARLAGPGDGGREVGGRAVEPLLVHRRQARAGLGVLGIAGLRELLLDWHGRRHRGSGGGTGRCIGGRRASRRGRGRGRGRRGVVRGDGRHSGNQQQRDDLDLGLHLFDHLVTEIRAPTLSSPLTPIIDEHQGGGGAGALDLSRPSVVRSVHAAREWGGGHGHRTDRVRRGLRWGGAARVSHAGPAVEHLARDGAPRLPLQRWRSHLRDPRRHRGAAARLPDRSRGGRDEGEPLVRSPLRGAREAAARGRGVPE